MNRMAKSITPGPRQFTLQTLGQTVGLNSAEEPWNAATTGGSTVTYWTQTYADLRGLIGVDSKSLGLATLSISLQESSDFFITPALDQQAWGWAYDILTTVELSEDSILRIGHALQTATEARTPGFLPSSGAFGITSSPRDEQSLNPSQVVWGSWRFMAVNSAFRMGSQSATQTVQSSMFGQGDIVTSQGLYYTRIFVVNDDLGSVCIPAANLVIWGAVKKVTEAFEMASMMRAWQR